MVSAELLSAVNERVQLLQEGRESVANWRLLLEVLQGDEAWAGASLVLEPDHDIPVRLGAPTPEMRGMLCQMLADRVTEVEYELRRLLQDLRDELVAARELREFHLPGEPFHLPDEPTPPPHPKAASLGRPE